MIWQDKVDQWIASRETNENSLSAVSARAGIPQSTIQSHMQSRVGDMDVRNMLALAKFMGITVEQLLDEKAGWQATKSLLGGSIDPGDPLLLQFVDGRLLAILRRASDSIESELRSQAGRLESCNPHSEE